MFGCDASVTRQEQAKGQNRDLKHDGAERWKESISLMTAEVTKLTNLKTTTLEFVLHKNIKFPYCLKLSTSKRDNQLRDIINNTPGLPWWRSG